MKKSKIDTPKEDLTKPEKKAVNYLGIKCKHTKTTKHMLTGITYCLNPNCQIILNIE